MALTGTFTPKLGLDLRGGTSVILTPRSTVAGGKVDSGAVDKAVDVIRQRVNGLGVAEAEVKRAGDRIEISVPGRGRSDVVDLVGQTAELRFREVAESGPAAPVPSPAPSPAVPSPRATPSPGRGPGVAPPPPPTATTRPTAEGRVPLAGPDVAVPAAQRSPVPAPRPTASPPPSGDASTPPPAAVAAYQRLACAKSDIRQGRVSSEGPQDWLAACDRDGRTKYLLKPAEVVGTDVKGATATVDNSQTSTGQWQVMLSFTGGGQGKFTRLTERTVGKQVAIVLDGVVQSAPTIQDRISGDAQITGNFTQSEAEDLANILRYGALPLAFEKSQAESISPTLGRDSLHAGLLAGALGLLLVVVYSFVYYRALGVVTIASLLVSGALVYAGVVLLGEAIDFTLTLAGVAGLIVSVGVTADSFIVFYERLKDEAREGRSVRTSVERGWVRARRTI
ncbi:MAG TPA: protein translocase subunit SecD, partial [Frankiaceae bacterium]|nr:protein translocase subunit SecD [Frankiaceae bacterium]